MDIQDFLDQGDGKEEDKIAAWNLFQQAYELQMKGQLEEAVDVYQQRGLRIAKSEALVVENTREIYPNCFVTGLAVAAVDGSPRMGPAFGSMLLSGRRAAELVRQKLKGEE